MSPKSKWQTIAVIFIVLFAIMVFLFISAYSIGQEIMNNEQTCQFDICSSYDAYYYFDDGYCSCYEDGKAVVTKLIIH